MAKKVKIKDIASKLNLSCTLVSLVLNNKADKQGIKAETQKKVIALAQKMGYYENEKVDPVSDLFDMGPGIIGMVVSTLKDPFFTEISDHLRKAFASIGYGFSIITWDKNDIRFRRVVSNLKRIYSGIILAGDAADDNLIRALKASDFPFVILEKSDVNLMLNIVKTDCEAGANLLANHLKGFKYSRITLLHPDTSEAYIVDKIKCSLAILKAEMLDSIIDKKAIGLDADGEIDIEEIRALLRSESEPDLIIVSNSELVYPLVNILNELNVRVPKDLAIISMEDGIGFDLFETPVTRLKRDISSISSKAVSILWTEIKNSGKSKHKRAVNIAPNLIIRRSCGHL